MFTLSPTAGPAPVIETEHLRLRGHGLADLADNFALWNDIGEP